MPTVRMQFCKPDLQQNYFIAGSGGNENGKYRFSLGYLNMDGIVINTSFKKYTGDMSATVKLLDSKKLGIDFGVNVSQYIKDGSDLIYGNAGIIQNALTWNPTDPLRNPDGSLQMTAGHGVNPIAYSQYVKDNLKVTTVLGTYRLTTNFRTGLNTNYWSASTIVPVSPDLLLTRRCPSILFSPRRGGQHR